MSNLSTAHQNYNLGLACVNSIGAGRKLPGVVRQVPLFPIIRSSDNIYCTVCAERHADNFSYMLRRFLESREDSEPSEDSALSETSELENCYPNEDVSETDGLSSYHLIDTNRVPSSTPLFSILLTYFQEFLQRLGFLKSDSIHSQVSAVYSPISLDSSQVASLSKYPNVELASKKIQSRSPNSVLDLTHFEREGEDSSMEDRNKDEDHTRSGIACWRFSQVQKNMPLWERRNMAKPIPLDI